MGGKWEGVYAIAALIVCMPFDLSAPVGIPIDQDRIERRDFRQHDCDLGLNRSLDGQNRR